MTILAERRKLPSMLPRLFLLVKIFPGAQGKDELVVKITPWKRWRRHLVFAHCTYVPSWPVLISCSITAGDTQARAYVPIQDKHISWLSIVGNTSL